MEPYTKYKLLKRYHSARDIVVVSREDGDNIGCELDAELGKTWIKDNELVFGPNIAFFKSLNIIKKLFMVKFQVSLILRIFTKIISKRLSSLNKTWLF